jgi:hypothetical protein
MDRLKTAIRPQISARSGPITGSFSRPMTNEEALSLFRQTGALLDGHFILRSGLHSRQFFQCALALQEMPLVERF